MTGTDGAVSTFNYKERPPGFDLRRPKRRRPGDADLHLDAQPGNLTERDQPRRQPVTPSATMPTAI